MTQAPILLATRSSGKLRELGQMFAGAGIQVLQLDQAGIPETAAEADIECFDTFEANALAKARYFFARAGGMPVVADDSGLEVLSLGGLPGVRSKRWSGRDDLAGADLDAANNARLVNAVRDLEDCRARYVCVAAYLDAEREITTRGEVSGTISTVPRGANGFGYDPYFTSSELGCTFGEASDEEKEGVSHRARAFGALMQQLIGG